MPKLEDGSVAPPILPLQAAQLLGAAAAASSSSSIVPVPSSAAAAAAIRDDRRERRFACNRCCRRYVRKISLQRHQKYECGKEQHLSCQYQGCNYKTYYHCSLKKHMMIHGNR